ncbi:hypothetical protein C7N43_22455, partial [Sphingobacteriales bacterium UPWRP_1]
MLCFAGIVLNVNPIILKAEELPTFNIDFTPNPADGSVIEVELNLETLSGYLHNGCLVNIDISLSFYSEDFTSLEEQLLPLTFWGNEYGPGFSFLVPTNMMYEYTITSCSNAAWVIACIDFYYSGGASCSNDASDYQCAVSWNGEQQDNFVFQFMAEPGAEQCTDFNPIVNADYILPLDVDIVSSIYVCGSGQLLYAVPYGGCPPYTVVWEDNFGNNVNWFDAPETIWNASALSVFPFADIITGVIAAQIGSYQVVVTDGNGNTASQVYAVTTDFSNSYDYTVSYTTECTAIVTITPTLGEPQISGTTLQIVPEYLYGSPILPSCQWPCTLTKTLTESGTYYIVLIENDNEYIYCYNWESFTLNFDAPNIQQPYNQTICSGDAITATTTANVSQWEWSTGLITTEAAETTFFPAAPGAYSVTLTDANGCTATAATTVALFEPPNPQINMLPDICTVMLTASGGTTYLWSTGETTPDIVVATPGIYSVTVTDANGCTAQAQYEVLADDIAPADFGGNYTVGAMATPLDQQDAAGNETWGSATANLRLAGTIIIPTGKTLTIKETNLYMVGQNTKFIVEKGGILRIENATLQGDNCADDFWQGIQAHGTPNLPHQIDPTTADPNTMYDPNTGMVYLENATIKQAKIAVANAAVDFTAIPISNIYANTGGMVIARNSNFENNEIGLYFFAFKPRNHSLITGCRFEANALFPGNFDIFGEQIGIVQMRGFFKYPLTENTFIHNLTGTPIHRRG